MRDRFFEVENCDRCGRPLNGCRIMSMYNHEVLCMDCKDKETQREDYRKAVEVDHEQIRRGNYNFEGIGLKGFVHCCNALTSEFQAKKSTIIGGQR